MEGPSAGEKRGGEEEERKRGRAIRESSRHFSSTQAIWMSEREGFGGTRTVQDAEGHHQA